jgi:hypothetical protein
MTNEEKGKEYFGIIKAIIAGLEDMGFDASITYSMKNKFSYRLAHKEYADFGAHESNFEKVEDAIQEMQLKVEPIIELLKIKCIKNLKELGVDIDV